MQIERSRRFDAARSACRNAGRDPYSFSYATPSEFVEVCNEAEARGRTFTVSPVGGP